MTRLIPLILLIPLAVLGCASDAPSLADAAAPGDGALDAAPGDAGDARSTDATIVPTSCGFGYEEMFVEPSSALEPVPGPIPQRPAAPVPGGVDRIAHVEPAPLGHYRLSWIAALLAGRTFVPPEDLVLPVYKDTSALFERAGAWETATRCFETPAGARELSEAQAYDLYRAIAEQTTGVLLDATAEVRTVVGLRGAYPGTFAWHGNRPDRFNDALALLWIDAAGKKHVREFPVNTDTGAHDFGYHNSSSLRPNRRYRHVNGWHSSYNALSIDESGHRVRDDTNHNGHWDSDRNGWLPPASAEDHDRAGSGHNIHMAALNGPLGEARIGAWSAGCQVIPGEASWIEFITNAWTAEGAPVSYYLIDVRDIAPQAWGPCAPEGTLSCPLRVVGLPFETAGDTSSKSSLLAEYSCTAPLLGGPEIVYALTVDRSGTLFASLESAAPAQHHLVLLDGADERACAAQHASELRVEVTPGRYFVVVETPVQGGAARPGSFTLRVTM